MIDRRSLLAGSGIAVALLGAASHAEQSPTSSPNDSVASLPPKMTEILARYVVESKFEDLPVAVRREGRRTLLNWVAVTVGGSRHETLEVAVRALVPFSGPAQASLLGRRERLDVLNAAFLNGVASHVFDYDDTHLKTVIHPGGPVISALMAWAELHPVSGREFLNALVVGVEVACRVGNGVYPDHYDAGWHITGTAGVIGAAAAVARLMRLDVQRTVWALGLAASQPVGFRESFGSMNKSFNPGRAASNGLFAAILAQQGYTSSDAMLEARRGWAQTISTKRDYAAMLDGLGQRYEAALNTYKPFACGIVLHPAIDAAIQLRTAHALEARSIERVDLRVHPLVLELTGKRSPRSGLEGKFSVYHAVAVAIVEGAAGEHQFSDRAVQDPTIAALAERVRPIVTPGIAPEQVELTITLRDGRKFERRIERAIGSVENPMSDAALEQKFRDLAVNILPADRVSELIGLCRDVETLASAAEIATRAAQIIGSPA